MSNINLDNCPACNRPKISYKDQLIAEDVLFIRNDRILLMQELKDKSDERNSFIKLLTSVRDTRKEKNPKLSELCHAVLENLNEDKEEIGETFPVIVEAGTLDTEHFLTQMETEIGCSTGFLPEHCRYYKRKKNANSNIHQFIISRQAGVFDFILQQSDSKYLTYQLSVPFFHIFLSVIENQGIFSYAAASIFITKTRELSENVEIFRFPAHNMNDVGTMCTGTITFENGNNLQTTVNNYSRKIYQSGWNRHLQTDFGMIPVELGGTYQKWAELSVADPYCSLKKEIQWNKLSKDIRTLNDLLEKLS